MNCVVKTKNFAFAFSLVLRKVTTRLYMVNVRSEIMAGVWYSNKSNFRCSYFNGTSNSFMAML